MSYLWERYVLIDHDDEDGLFAGWKWQCQNCDYKEKEER